MNERLALMSDLPRKFALTLPDNFNLDRYCYFFCGALSELYKSATGENVYDWPWNGSDEQILLIRRTPLWAVFNDIYRYAEYGNTESLYFDGKQWSFNDDSILFAMEWISAINMLSETTAPDIDINIGKLLIHKFLARFKLDGHSFTHDHVNYTITHDCAHIYLPMMHNTGLNIFEVGLLAGVSNLRTIRNATYDKNNPLQVIKEGHSVYVDINEARRWLSGRRGFVPTPGINYAEKVDTPPSC